MSLPFRMNETQLKGVVLEYASLMGWLIHHDRPARTNQGWRTAIEGDAGFPDLVLARIPRLVVVELKDAYRKTSREQDIWLGAFEGIPGVETHIWRPRDWQDGTVQSVLKR